MTRAHIDRVKRDVPGSKVVAYWDFGDMPLHPVRSEECPFCTGHIMGDRPGRNCSTTYTCGASAFLDKLQGLPGVNQLAVHDITNGTPGVMLESYPGLAKYVWNARSAPLLATFLADWIKQEGFDGLYMDGYVEPDRVDFSQCTLKEEGCQSFMKPGHKYDMDGDGVPDTSADFYGSYFAWGPAFVASLREMLGKDAVLLANSAGSMSDASLSGLTIEMESCVATYGGIAKCADALSGQRMSSTSAGIEPVSVLWLTHSESMNATVQCQHVKKLQEQYPWVQAGTDFFDGSHVVC